MSVQIGINGLGRIGRLVLRESLRNPQVTVTAINDVSDVQMLAHLLKYDSVHGKLEEGVSVKGNHLVVGNKEIRVTSEKEPEKIDWESNGAEIIIESTGKFRSRTTAAKHLEAGAKKVIITAPGKGVDATFVLGVNHQTYDNNKHHVVSNASCTTNCLAPVVKVLHEQFGLRRGMVTTVHSYTNDQHLLDLPHKDYRRARAAAENIIPTTTGAAEAVAQVLPELEGKLTGGAVRVPTPNVSLVDLTAEVESKVTVQDINTAFKKASEQDLKNILGYSEEPLVSSDYNGNTQSSIVDALSTMVLKDNMMKVIAWYDNEYAYSLRVIELAAYMARA